MEQEWSWQLSSIPSSTTQVKRSEQPFLEGESLEREQTILDLREISRAVSTALRGQKVAAVR
jgi:hypothetical protein